MKYGLMTVIVLGLMFSPALGQQSHVVTRYEKSVDATVVHSDLLYVINMPSQFMQIQLMGRNPKQGKPTLPPDRLEVEIYSYAPQPLYQMDVAHRLLVKADDKVLDFGLLSYSNASEKNKSNDKDKDKKKVDEGMESHLEVSVALPSTALIAATRKDTGLTVEFMSIEEPSLADLTTIAKANSVLMKIGKTVFPLTAMHRTILREFVEAITPLNLDAASLIKPPSPPLPPDVPSDANKMSLDETLTWLKNHLDREGATKDIILPRKLETVDFKGCRIGYRKVPRFRNVQGSDNLVYAIMETQLDLADLNAEATSISDHKDYATVLITTRDYQPKIKVIKHANTYGTTGRTLGERFDESDLINLRSAEAAYRFKVALTHAIHLCQNQP